MKEIMNNDILYKMKKLTVGDNGDSHNQLCITKGCNCKTTLEEKKGQPRPLLSIMNNIQCGLSKVSSLNPVFTYNDVFKKVIKGNLDTLKKCHCLLASKLSLRLLVDKDSKIVIDCYNKRINISSSIMLLIFGRCTS